MCVKGAEAVLVFACALVYPVLSYERLTVSACAGTYVCGNQECVASVGDESPLSDNT